MKTIMLNIAMINILISLLSCSQSNQVANDSQSIDTAFGSYGINMKADNSKKLIIDENLYNDTSSNYQCGNIQSIEVVGDSLKISIMYSGCASGIDFKLISDGSIAEEYKPSMKVKLVGKEEGTCEPAWSQNLTFDLSPIKNRLKKGYKRTFRLLIRDKVIEYNF